MKSVVATSALMTYALWTLEGADRPWMLEALPFVGYAIFRYQYLSENGEGESPEETLLCDPVMLFSSSFGVHWHLLLYC
jgi:hypothetical protein